MEKSAFADVPMKLLDESLNKLESFIELQTYFSWVASINRKWICIYDNSKYIPKFKSGCSNGKKYKRIQVIYSNETANIL